METLTDELKRYVRLSADDAARITAFRDRARPHFRRIAQEFYDRIREHEEAHAVFTNEEQITRLQHSMVLWLERVFGGTYDAAYFAQTERIGHVHVNVGLPQRYMLTAMAVIRSSLFAIVDELAAPAEAAPLGDALSRLLDIELAVMLESYQERSRARLQRVMDLERDALSERIARKHRYLNAVELAAVLIVGLDASGRVLLFNREAERVTGYERDEVMGRSFVELFVPTDLREAGAAGFESIPSQGRVELPLLTRSHKHREIRWQIVRAPADGDDVQVFGIGTDVTDERIAQQRHEQQERLAAVGTLAAGLAHEIRNPLNGAQLHVSFLERALVKSDTGAEALEAVHVVRDEIQRLARLVTEFLDFARPRPLTRSPTNVRSLCERALQLVRGQAETAKVEVHLDLPTNDVVIAADPQRLEQVLLNLLQNAIQALEPKGGNVSLRVRREPRHVAIEVEDDGPGLPPGHAPIFDAFFSTKANGTGLGLAIVHRIVTDHGATIDVDSQPGRTRFRVKLPLLHDA